jgi:hypothetical protein
VVSEGWCGRMLIIGMRDADCYHLIDHHPAAILREGSKVCVYIQDVLVLSF